MTRRDLIASVLELQADSERNDCPAAASAAEALVRAIKARDDVAALDAMADFSRESLFWMLQHLEPSAPVHGDPVRGGS